MGREWKERRAREEGLWVGDGLREGRGRGEEGGDAEGERGEGEWMVRGGVERETGLGGEICFGPIVLYSFWTSDKTKHNQATEWFRTVFLGKTEGKQEIT